MRLITTPVVLDRDRAIGLVERLSAATHLIASAEYLVNDRDRAHGGFNNWQVARRALHARSAALGRAVDVVAHPVTTRRLHVARIAAALALQFPLPRAAKIAANAVLAGTSLALYPRQHYGTDGSDQVSFLCQTVVALARIGSRDPRTVDACLWFVSLQSVLSYAVSGWVKLTSDTWRSGEALTGIMRTLTYGDRTMWTLLRRHPRTGKAVGKSVLLLECAFPAVFLGRGRLTPAFVASAAAFHLANARVMALGRFFWSFLAMHPAVIYTTGPRRISGPRRDDAFPLVCAAITAGFLVAGQAARVRDQAVVRAGRRDEREFTATSGDVLSYRCAGPEDATGPLLVFACGLAATAEHFEWLVRGLSDRHRTVVYDRAGYGRSRAASSPDDLGTAVADLVELTRHVAGDRPVVLVGHSLGGYLALRAVSGLGGQVVGVAMLDSSHPGELARSPRQRQGAATLTTSFAMMPTSLRLGLGPLLKRPYWVDRMPEDSRGLVFAQYRDPRLWRTGRQEWRATMAEFDAHVGTLPPCPVPAMVLTAGRTADNDPVQVELHDELAANSPAGRRLLLADADHDQVLTDPVAARRVVGHLLDFLSDIETGMEPSDADAAS